MKILIAEDNQFTVNQYSKILEKNGHDVTITNDGVECLDKYKEKLCEFDSLDAHPFDVVILDNNMPKKNGAEVAKSILDEKPDQRIIFASAYDIDSLFRVPDNLKESVEILEKPFSLNTMLIKIEKKSAGWKKELSEN